MFGGKRVLGYILAGICAAMLLVALPGLTRGDTVAPLDPRKGPMRFAWYAQGAGAPGVVAAVGTVTGDTPAAFERLARVRDLRGATMVLNSGGGSVLDTLTLGRRWRALGIATTVGTVVAPADRDEAAVHPDAVCESMCAFLLLAGTPRHVPQGAAVRVHQIWMGDRVSDARRASYSAQDMTIVQRDVGQLAQYTFEMGGSGALLALALSVPPWEPLHELSPEELVAAHLVTRDGDAVAAPKPLQDRLAVSGAGRTPAGPGRLEGTETAAAATGGMAAAAAAAAGPR